MALDFLIKMARSIMGSGLRFSFQRTEWFLSGQEGNRFAFFLTEWNIPGDKGYVVYGNSLCGLSRTMICTAPHLPKRVHVQKYHASSCLKSNSQKRNNKHG